MNNIKNIFRATALSAFGVFVMAACTDTWDEHYDGTTGGLKYAGTTMEYIDSKSNLSDFAEVLRATGYDKDLAAGQVLTIFAPQNGTFNKDSLLQIVADGNRKRVIERFVKNHILLYNVSVTEQEQTQALLNGKQMSVKPVFDEEGNLVRYEVGNVPVAEQNVSCKNGVVQVLEGDIPYLNNVYELLENEYEQYLAANGLEEDSLTLFHFLKSYDVDSLDEAHSVPRGIDADGNTVYVDSVMIRNNRVLNGLDAFLYREDSSYMAILPSIDAYKKRYEEVSRYFHFSPLLNRTNAAYRDSVQNFSAHYYTLSELFYNRNRNTHSTDSLVATTFTSRRWPYGIYYNPYNPGGLMSGVKDLQECSNGVVALTDEMPYSIYDNFFRTITVEGESSGNVVTDDTYSSTDMTNYMRVSRTADSISNNAFMFIQPKTSRSQVKLSYRIPNVLSGTYDIYVKFLPYHVYDTDTVGKTILPLQFRCSYWEADSVTGEMPRRAVNLTNPETGNRNFQTNPMSIDTVYVGTVKFDRCYQGLTAGVYLTIESYVTNTQLKNFTREMLLDCIIFKPHRDADITVEPDEPQI